MIVVSNIAFSCAAFWGYCNAATAPTLTSGGNANSPTPQTSVGSTTSFTCNPGYMGNLSYTCTSVGGGTAAGSGIWSPSTIADTCTGSLSLTRCLFLDYFIPVWVRIAVLNSRAVLHKMSC